MNAVEILRQLVAIPTPSSVSNLPLMRCVAAYLEPRGWRIEWLNWTDESGMEKANLIARPVQASPETAIDLAFVCHTDTVPYSAHWQDALRLTEREGDLHGCGACDVKGPLACFLAAAASIAAPSPRVALILTADEEVGCKGMERLLADKRFGTLRIGSAIVSEPTSLRPGVAGKGYGLARITVQGREAHSAFPQQGVSAISVAAKLIFKIEDAFAAHHQAASSPLEALFDPPRSTVNIGVIQGGTAKNIVAGTCSFLVEWRPLPGEPHGSTLARIAAQAEETERNQQGVAIRVEGLRDEPGFAPSAAGALQTRLASLLPGAPTGISFGSEASRIARIADEVIVIGPGDMRTAHSDRECVPQAELELWTRVLAALIAP